MQAISHVRCPDIIPCLLSHCPRDALLQNHFATTGTTIPSAVRVAYVFENMCSVENSPKAPMMTLANVFTYSTHLNPLML